MSDNISTPRASIRSARWSKLSYRLALLIVVLLGLSAIVTTTFAVRSVQHAMFTESSTSMENVHASMNSLISVEYQSILDFRSAALENRRKALQDVSAPVLVALDQLRSAADRGEISEAAAKSSALAMLKAVRFGNADYFYTYDSGMTAIAHPDAKFQGRNLINLKDADGRFVIREIRDVALSEGAGFVEYRWVRLNEAVPSSKIGYVFHYKPWDWIIGTGVYVDDIDIEGAARQAAIEAQLSAAFGELSFSSDSTFFILDEEGRVVVAPEGADLSSLSSAPQGEILAAALVASAPEQDGEIAEVTETASLRDGPAEEWVMTTSRFGALGWVLVSAVPKSELTGPGQTLAFQQALLSIVVLAIGLSGGLLLSRRLVRPVESITSAALALGDGTFDPSTLDAAASRKDEVGELARTVQRMGKEILERERKLREQVARLTVVIDHSKVAQAVDEITETDYFQRLKARADEMRNRKD